MTNKTVNALTKKRIAGFVRDNPSFTESQVRWSIFHAEENGLANFGAVHRVGRTVWIDERAFFAWMESDPPGRNQYVEREAKSGLPAGAAGVCASPVAPPAAKRRIGR